MLDYKCLSVLEYIIRECKTPNYKILSTKEILSAMPREYAFDVETIFSCLETLFSKGYVSIKYKDENEICISPLPKGRQVFENRLDEEINKVKTIKTCATFSFLGSILGSLITGVAFFLLFVLGAR